MKRQTRYNKLVLDDLLLFALSYDEGKFSLDSYEIYELMNSIFVCAQASLGTNSELRLGSASVEKDSSGHVTVRLGRRGLFLPRSPEITIHAA